MRPVATFNKYNQFSSDLCSGVHQFQTGTTHVLKILLSNTAPDASGHAVRADASELSAGNGYTSGGISVGVITGANSNGTFKVSGDTDPVWTATGTLTFRYAILFNDTPTSPSKPLIGWWDYGSSVTLNSGETFKVDIDQANGLFTVG